MIGPSRLNYRHHREAKNLSPFEFRFRRAFLFRSQVSLYEVAYLHHWVGGGLYFRVVVTSLRLVHNGQAITCDVEFPSMINTP